ncbi:LacI family transcriptional regulator [Oleiagrimonas sp. C23AA]|nr:LacI family DNA-binding transcriptional regulator [Oleiagrimonas sp. C23AA]NII11898.1 LacI family transcriptional regulator [Oleiagrimonas sp. C23AA]
MADLARIAGVSKITVSRALSDSPLVNEKTRERVREIARQHGYKLNVSARNLRLRRSQTVAVIVEMKPSADRAMWHPYPLILLGGISQELTSAGYSVVLTTRGSKAPAAQAADGMILLGQGAREDAVHQFDRWHMPMVVWGAPGENEAHITVGSDNRRGGAAAAERFLAMRRHRPLFLGNPDYPELRERLAGFSDALGRHGIEPQVLVLGAFSPDAGYEAVRKLLSKRVRFDAIFAGSDLLAMGAVRALIEAGRRVPEDVSVIGYDDVPMAAQFIPPLSTVSQNWQEGGELLARKVLALIEGQPAQSEMLPSTLVVRAT